LGAAKLAVDLVAHTDKATGRDIERLANTQLILERNARYKAEEG